MHPQKAFYLDASQLGMTTALERNPAELNVATAEGASKAEGNIKIEEMQRRCTEVLGSNRPG